MRRTRFNAGVLDAAFFARSVHEIAPELIGATLLVDGVGGVIVEVEAYAQEDPASHSFRGRTARNAVMFGPPGHVYVYRSYGLHWCMNLVCAEQGRAEAVLLRALEPAHGLDVMAARRRTGDRRLLASGPGRLCEALGITGALDGARVDAPPFALHPRAHAREVVSGPRVGISQAVDAPWRYADARSRFLSRPASWRPPAPRSA